MSTYIPDENGELTALDTATGEIAQTAIQMPTGDLGAAFAKMLITLVILVVLLFASYWFIRRMIQNRLQKGAGDSSIHILEKRMISPKTMLYLVKIDNRKILLAESHLDVKRLADLQTHE